MAAHLRLATTAKDAGVRLPIRIVLADDHAVVRRSLRMLLDTEDDLEVVAEASDVSAVVDEVHRRIPHVLVLDLRLGRTSNIALIHQLREQVPDMQIVVLTMEESPQFAQYALNGGAIGFVLKDRADSELPAAVRAASRGEEFVSARVAPALEALRDGAAGKDRLSPRESEILRLIALGYTSAQIAETLRLSRRTVETHRSRVYHKLGLTTRAELVQVALRRHLIGG